jgi:18S rRNA (guanine1575-N7)-methyltransferase
MKKTNQNGWKVKSNRPEEIYSSPSEYYTKDLISKYSKASHMRRIQRKIIHRLIELMDLPPKGIVLELGCAWGYSGEYMMELGYDVIGIDIIDDFLIESQKRGLKVKKLDMRDLNNEFNNKTFDIVFSISALQWIKRDEDMQKVANSVFYVIKDGGIAGFQFYPKSENEMKRVAKFFSDSGFEGQIIIDNPNNLKKRLIFLILKKKINEIKCSK